MVRNPKWDERSMKVAGQSAMIVLGLMQAALGVIILVRAYVLDQPDAQFRDLQWLLFGSILSYLTLRSFLGGIMPVPTLRQALAIYAGLVVALGVILSLWFGLPGLDEWSTTILPVIVGPAIIVGGYTLIAWLGKHRIEREISEEH